MAQPSYYDVPAVTMGESVVRDFETAFPGYQSKYRTFLEINNDSPAFLTVTPNGRGRAVQVGPNSSVVVDAVGPIRFYVVAAISENLPAGQCQIAEEGGLDA